MSTVTIPSDLASAKETLTGIEALLTAKGWARAAIVAAYVQPNAGNGGKPSTSGRFSAAAFAALGIAGLKSPQTVLDYVKAWDDTGKPRPKPGETVELPADDWPPKTSLIEVVKKNTKAVAEALSDPEVSQKVLDRMEEPARAALSQQTTQSLTEDLAARGGGRLPVEGEDFNKPDPPELGAAIAEVERKGRHAELIDKTIRAVKAYGDIRGDEEMMRRYEVLKLELLYVLPSAAEPKL